MYYYVKDFSDNVYYMIICLFSIVIITILVLYIYMYICVCELNYILLFIFVLNGSRILKR